MKLSHVGILTQILALEEKKLHAPSSVDDVIGNSAVTTLAKLFFAVGLFSVPRGKTKAFQRCEIRFDDISLTNRALQYGMDVYFQPFVHMQKEKFRVSFLNFEARRRERARSLVVFPLETPEDLRPGRFFFPFTTDGSSFTFDIYGFRYWLTVREKKDILRQS